MIFPWLCAQIDIREEADASGLEVLRLVLRLFAVPIGVRHAEKKVAVKDLWRLSWQRLVCASYPFDTLQPLALANAWLAKKRSSSDRTLWACV